MGWRSMGARLSDFLIFLIAMAAVLAVQYTSRDTVLARTIGGVGISVCLVFLVANIGWRQAFALTSAVSGAPAEATRIRVTFDAE